MSLNNPKLYIGFITYSESTVKYLPYFLSSFKEQTFQDFKILAVDATEIEDDNLKILRSHPEIEIISAGINYGFAKGFNQLIREAKKQGADYFLALNPDMIFEPDMIEKLYEAVSSDENIAAVQPKILKWDFENKKKTDTVDSYGLVIDKFHRFFDREQGKIDHKKYREVEEIFGFTGAAVLFNLKALEDIRFENEYFDELMFMYKEDCDLSYRLRLAGWKIILAPAAVAYHDRTAEIIGQGILTIGLNRKNKKPQLKKWSFLNNLILLYKIKNLPYSFKIRLSTWYYLICSSIFAFLFENYLMDEFKNFKKIKHEIFKKQAALKIKIDIKEIERFMK